MVVATILLGSMSDVIGRRPLIILSCLSSFFKQIIYDVIMKFDLDLTYCFVGNVVDGMSGSFCTLMLAGFAFTADLTPPEKTRTNAIAIVEFFLQISYLAGQLTVGFLIQNLGYFYASLWPSAFVFMALCISVFFLPETIGMYGAVGTAIKAVTGLFAVHVLQKFLSDPIVIAIGLLSYSSSLVFEGLAQNDVMLYVAVVVNLVSPAAIPVNRSLLSKMAGADRQGALFSSVAIMETLSTLTSNSLYNEIYEATVAQMRGAVFLFMAGFTFLTAMLSIVFRLLSRRGVAGYEKIIPQGSAGAHDSAM
nr:hypothetical protein BaRGS_014160 [Batillaria attramentaria]